MSSDTGPKTAAPQLRSCGYWHKIPALLAALVVPCHQLAAGHGCQLLGSVKKNGQNGSPDIHPDDGDDNAPGERVATAVQVQHEHRKTM